MNAQHVSPATGNDFHRRRTAAFGRPTHELVIRRLRATDLPAVEAHLLALDSCDRHSRFHALLGDDAIRDYIGRIDFERMILIGAFDEGSERLVGMAEAHLDAAATRGTRRADFYYQTSNRTVARLVRDLGAPIATSPGFASLALPLGTPSLH